jgi:hypothetical protein
MPRAALALTCSLAIFSAACGGRSVSTEEATGATDRRVSSLCTDIAASGCMPMASREECVQVFESEKADAEYSGCSDEEEALFECQSRVRFYCQWGTLRWNTGCEQLAKARGACVSG